MIPLIFCVPKHSTNLQKNVELIREYFPIGDIEKCAVFADANSFLSKNVSIVLVSFAHLYAWQCDKVKYPPTAQTIADTTQPRPYRGDYPRSPAPS